MGWVMQSMFVECCEYHIRGHTRRAAELMTFDVCHCLPPHMSIRQLDDFVFTSATATYPLAREKALHFLWLTWMESYDAIDEDKERSPEEQQETTAVWVIGADEIKADQDWVDNLERA
eukprot:538486-Prorocentrum_minimum.AAC.1